MALGGLLAALAVVIMCLGGLIPLATYVIPMLCGLLVAVVCRYCGSRTAWAWYAAVSLLGLIMGPDKEAAVLFPFVGYYPILKPKLEKLPLKWLWKLAAFNVGVLAAYGIMFFLLGMAQLAAEFRELGEVALAVTLLLGNVTFFLFDRLLTRLERRNG